jgi:hypothetical protein
VFSFHHRIWPGILFALTFLIPTSPSVAGTDFLVVEKVERLQIYNRYQQEATSRERQRVVPFVPMKILKSDDVLGDGFTRCVQVEIDGEIFFLLKDKQGEIIRPGPAGFVETFRNVSVLLDTIRIRSNTSIAFMPVNSANQHSLSIGEIVVRIFRHGDRTYCRMPGMYPAFGWIDFSGKKEGREWEVLRRMAPVSESIPNEILNRVRTKVDEVNSLLARLFEYFNTQSHQQKPAPQWTVETSGKVISCMLQGTAITDGFQESTRYLINDIENIVLGTELQVVHSPGRIEIRPR